MFVGFALAVIVTGGLYVRRRICGALRELGAGERKVRFVRWLIIWLLFGFPVVAIVSITISLYLGRPTVPRFDGKAASWFFAIPFAWSVLVTVQSIVWLVAIDIAHLLIRRRRGVSAAARFRALAVLGVVGVFAIYTPARVAAEHGDLRVRHHQLVVGTTTAPPFRIAFIADIQQDDHLDADRARHVYSRVNASSPDLILSGGDWINSGPDHIAATAEAASMLSSRLGTFSVRGDHEHFAYVDRHRSVREIEQALRARNIAMVTNEVRWFDHHGKRIAVVFLNYNYIVRSDREVIRALVASVENADYSIVVTHQLDAALAELLADRVDLVLGAHTHGGQVNPVLGLTHVNLARVETKFVDGRYRLGATTTVIVTAGVGYSIIPIRYASPGSIELIELSL